MNSTSEALMAILLGQVVGVAILIAVVTLLLIGGLMWCAHHGFSLRYIRSGCHSPGSANKTSSRKSSPAVSESSNETTV